MAHSERYTGRQDRKWEAGAAYVKNSVKKIVMQDDSLKMRISEEGLHWIDRVLCTCPIANHPQKEKRWQIHAHFKQNYAAGQRAPQGTELNLRELTHKSCRPQIEPRCRIAETNWLVDHNICQLALRHAVNSSATSVWLSLSFAHLIILEAIKKTYICSFCYVVYRPPEEF